MDGWYGWWHCSTAATRIADGVVNGQVMRNVMVKGESFIAQELERLGGMVQSRAVRAVKKTSFLLRINILRAFQMPTTASTTSADLER